MWRRCEIIALRAARLFIPKHADVGDAHVRQEIEHAFDQAEAGAQNGRDHDGPGERGTLRFRERRLHADRPGREIARRFEYQQRGEFIEPRPEIDGRRLRVAQLADLHADERMVDDGDSGQRVVRHARVVTASAGACHQRSGPMRAGQSENPAAAPPLTGEPCCPSPTQQR